jgi:hypothetical protein
MTTTTTMMMMTFNKAVDFFLKQSDAATGMDPA